MRTKTLGSVILAAVIAVGIAASPTPASAAATCVLGTPTVTPSSTVAIGPDGVLARAVSVKATSCPPEAAEALQMWWVMEAPGDIGEPGWPMLTSTNVGDTATFEATLEVNIGNALAGDRPTALWGETKKLRTAPTLHLRRASIISTSVFLARGYGSVVNKGDHLEIYPWLQRANWESWEYVDYNKTVSLQFRKKSGSYKTIKTSANSPFFVNATVDGCYRFVWKGNNTTAASKSAANCVDVK